MCVVGVITFINIVNVKASAKFQLMSSVISVTTLVIIAGLGFAHIGQGMWQ